MEANQQPATPPTETQGHTPATMICNFSPLDCPDCGIVFLIPGELHARRIESGGNLYCPNGHLIEIKLGDVQPLTMAATNLQLLKELRRVRLERETLANELARRPAPPQGVNERELARRVKYVANRAQHTEFGKSICRFCEAMSKTAASMRRHLKKEHLDEIRDLPREFFDQP